MPSCMKDMLVMRGDDGMSDTKINDIAAYVDAAAALVGLPIDPSYRAAVIANLERSQQIALLALAEDLPDDLEAAPVFRP